MENLKVGAVSYQDHLVCRVNEREMECVLEPPKAVQPPNDYAIFLGIIPEGVVWAVEREIVLATYEGMVLKRAEQRTPDYITMTYQSVYSTQTNKLICVASFMSIPHLFAVRSSCEWTMGPIVGPLFKLSPDGTRYCSPNWYNVTRGVVLDSLRFSESSTKVFGRLMGAETLLEFWNDGTVCLLDWSQQDGWKLLLWEPEGRLLEFKNILSSSFTRWVKRGRDSVSFFGVDHKERNTIIRSHSFKLPVSDPPGVETIQSWKSPGKWKGWRANPVVREIGFSCRWHIRHWLANRVSVAGGSLLVLTNWSPLHSACLLVMCSKIVTSRDSLRNYALSVLVTTLPLPTDLSSTKETTPEILDKNNTDACSLETFLASMPDEMCRSIALGFYDYRLRTERFTSVHDQQGVAVGKLRK